MRRPHRTIETFDISLMAVVTKAMGAFLVLMLLLLPYYTPDSSEDDAAELLRQLKSLNARLDDVSEQLGDPQRGVEELRKDLGKISVDATLRTEVIAKLEGLINKAFSEIRRLEGELAHLHSEVERLESQIATLKAENKRLHDDNKALASENRKLTDEVAALETENQKLRAEVEALLQRIAELEEELRRLKKNKPREEYQAVMAGYNVTRCDDVTVDGFIIKIGSEEAYTWNKDGSKIEPAFLFNATFGMDGGSVPAQGKIEETKYPKNSAYSAFASQPNSGMLTDMTVGQGDHAIIFIKKDRRKSYKVNDRPWSFLTKSRNSCTVRVDTAARASFVDDWASGISLSSTMSKNAIGGIVLAFTSNEKGINFRLPTDGEHEWFEKLLALALKTQDEIPEVKKEREEAERKAREAEEKRRREAEARRKRAEEAKKEMEERRRKEQALHGLMTSHVTPRDLRQVRTLEERIKVLPKGQMREHLELILADWRSRVELQIKETQEQLEKMPRGPGRSRAEQFLSELRKLGSEQ